MTLRDLADWLIYAGAVVGAFGSLGLAARWLGRRWHRWLREEVAALRAPIEETRRNSEQLTQNDGRNVADHAKRSMELSEQTLRRVDDLTTHVERNTVDVAEAKRIALSALEIATHRQT